jgi:hypothetical protein
MEKITRTTRFENMPADIKSTPGIAGKKALKPLMCGK